MDRVSQSLRSGAEFSFDDQVSTSLAYRKAPRVISREKMTDAPKNLPSEYVPTIHESQSTSSGTELTSSCQQRKPQTVYRVKHGMNNSTLIRISSCSIPAAPSSFIDASPLAVIPRASLDGEGKASLNGNVDLHKSMESVQEPAAVDAYERDNREVSDWEEPDEEGPTDHPLAEHEPCDHEPDDDEPSEWELRGSEADEGKRDEYDLDEYESEQDSIEEYGGNEDSLPQSFPARFSPSTARIPPSSAPYNPNYGHDSLPIIQRTIDKAWQQQKESFFHRAITLSQTALSLMKEVGLDNRSPVWAKASIQLTLAYVHLGWFEEIIYYYDEAVASRNQEAWTCIEPFVRTLVDTLYRRSNRLFAQKEYRQCLCYLGVLHKLLTRRECPIVQLLRPFPMDVGHWDRTPLARGVGPIADIMARQGHCYFRMGGTGTQEPFATLTEFLWSSYRYLTLLPKLKTFCPPAAWLLESTVVSELVESASHGSRGSVNALLRAACERAAVMRSWPVTFDHAFTLEETIIESYLFSGQWTRALKALESLPSLAKFDLLAAYASWRADRLADAKTYCRRGMAKAKGRDGQKGPLYYDLLDIRVSIYRKEGEHHFADDYGEMISKADWQRNGIIGQLESVRHTKLVERRDLRLISYSALSFAVGFGSLGRQMLVKVLLDHGAKSPPYRTW